MSSYMLGNDPEKYRLAISGHPDDMNDPDIATLHYQWKDKPHRLVYDLVGEVASLQKQIASARELAVGHLTEEYLRSIPERLTSSEARLRLAILAALDAPKEETHE